MLCKLYWPNMFRVRCKFSLIVLMSHVNIVLQDGYYMSNNQCIPCDCHPIGSNHTVCSKATGQCSCRPNIEGRRCNITQAGFSFRALDYIRFEAEDLSYSQVLQRVMKKLNNFTILGIY